MLTTETKSCPSQDQIMHRLIMRTFRTRGAHVVVKGIFFDTDGIPLLVAFVCVTDDATFPHYVSELLIGGVSWADGTGRGLFNY
jgi:hypothetical protein